MSEIYLPDRGTGLILGTARQGMQRGAGRRLTDMERAARHKAIFGQTFKQMLDRKPVRGAVLEALPMINQFPNIAKMMK
jgi:hypothetical protein